ncbi:MAG: UDP-N-acetylmuramate--L-alanine ligase [Simkaniaceae bacterium]|nr:UDP-N-acetylmuramate--L-alanine ligase [Simkaniaceae bacterium]
MLESKTHFIGIGGIGMSALARILLDRGESVSGSDRLPSPLVRELEREGAIFYEEKGLFPKGTRVVYGSAIGPEHPERVLAVRSSVETIHRSTLLKRLVRGKRAIYISGMHGKTSLSSLLTWVLIHAGADPSYAIGGIPFNTGRNGRSGGGGLFVAEADESDGSFLGYEKGIAVVTGIDEEHLDFWKNGERIRTGFRQFASRMEKVFYCAEGGELTSLLGKGESYGIAQGVDFCLRDVEEGKEGLTFSIVGKGRECRSLFLPLIGRKQAVNACAVWAVASYLNISPGEIREAFATFSGVKRRMEKRGEFGGVTLYEDYAHHPNEISATLASLKRVIGEKRLTVIFQPHRFSRTEELFTSFTTAFHDADRVFITDIYPAGERANRAVTGRMLADAVSGAGFVAEGERFAEGEFARGETVVVMGAGDHGQWVDRVVASCS